MSGMKRGLLRARGPLIKISPKSTQRLARVYLLLLSPIVSARSLSSNNTHISISMETAMLNPTPSLSKRTVAVLFGSYLGSQILAMYRGLTTALQARFAASKPKSASQSMASYHLLMEAYTTLDLACSLDRSTKQYLLQSIKSSTTEQSTTLWEGSSDEAQRSEEEYTLLPLGNGKGWMVVEMTSGRIWYPSQNGKSPKLPFNFLV